MDIRLIHYFISVYEEGSFTRAAERMHVVQPALSMQIRNLEEELGTALFDRTPRGTEPTPAGRVFYQLCVPIAHDLAAAKQAILDMVGGNQVSGAIRVGLPPSVARGILGKVLAEYAERYPNVDVTVVEAYSRYVTEQVRSGDLDFALGAQPGENSGLSCRLGIKDRLLIVSGKPIHGPTFTPIDLAQVKDLKLMLPSDRHLLGADVLERIMSGEIKPSRVMKVDGLISTLEMAAASDWGALVSLLSVFKELVSKQFYLYPIVAPRMRFDLYFVHDPGRPLSLANRRFIEILEIELAEVARAGLELLPQQ